MLLERTITSGGGNPLYLTLIRRSVDLRFTVLLTLMSSPQPENHTRHFADLGEQVKVMRHMTLLYEMSNNSSRVRGVGTLFRV